jgi:hypothetical protein
VDGALRIKILEARMALRDRDLLALARLLPSREHWRCYADFADEAVFLDVEADANRQPTVASLFHAQGLEVFIQGRNMEALADALARWRLWVTFNGTCFDLPILGSCFPKLTHPGKPPPLAA